MGVAARVWEDSPLRGVMAIDRLMALRLASGASISAWSFAALQEKRQVPLTFSRASQLVMLVIYIAEFAHGTRRLTPRLSVPH